MPDIFISPEDSEKKKDTSTPPKEPADYMEPDNKKGRNYHRLSAFIFYPNHVEFETKDKDEKIILLLRRHPITNLKWILLTIVLIIVPSFVKYFGILESFPSGFDFVITLSWYLFIMAYVLENFLSWYFNVYFVTNHRVIDVDFYNLIDKKVSDANIEKIQDVSYTNFGVPRILFNYGDVIIQTAAEISEFDFEAVPNPEKVVKIIGDLIPEGGSKV